jgi:hypothetical protein
VVVPNFSNPLGSLMPVARKRELVALCAKHQVALIESDVYGDLPFEGERPLPLKAFDERDEVIYCSSFSKTVAPSFRVGWIAPGRHFDAVVRAKFTHGDHGGAVGRLRRPRGAERPRAQPVHGGDREHRTGCVPKVDGHRLPHDRASAVDPPLGAAGPEVGADDQWSAGLLMMSRSISPLTTLWVEAATASTCARAPLDEYRDAERCLA